MPKTEDELRSWVVEHNRHTTHNRGLTSGYGYNRILDVDLRSVCVDLRSRFTPPIRILDVGCGNGTALRQLSEFVKKESLDANDFEFWGMGVNRYDEMAIDDDRLIVDGLVAHDFDGAKFHLIFSVFAFHYFWHKLEALEKIHNELLVDLGKTYLHFPGYLVRFGEAPEALGQTEVDGNQRFQEYLQHLEEDGKICPMGYTTVPSYSEDDDCVLLAEFGHIRFQKMPGAFINFSRSLQAFAMFDSGFAFRYMNSTPRTYVASHYEQIYQLSKSATVSFSRATKLEEDEAKDAIGTLPGENARQGPYRIESHSFQVEGQEFDLDVAVHEFNSDKVVLICPGAYEPLVGRVVPYKKLARAISGSGLGAVVRYNDPFNDDCDYGDFLLAKTRCMIEFALETALRYCSAADPQLHVMAYSSSAGAAAALAAEYSNIDSLLLIAPSFDLARDRVLPGYSKFQGNVRVLIGDSDEVVLPQQAFWYYQNAESASSHEYVEIPSCGHKFEGATNKKLFCRSAFWAFGDRRPDGFPAPASTPSEAW